jgi:hypothetical protein
MLISFFCAGLYWWGVKFEFHFPVLIPQQMNASPVFLGGTMYFEGQFKQRPWPKTERQNFFQDERNIKLFKCLGGGLAGDAQSHFTYLNIQLDVIYFSKRHQNAVH